MNRISKLLFFVIWSSGLLTLTMCEKKRDLPMDGDGNVYDTVVIGSQIWLAENLKTTRYSNGIAIPLVTDNLEWSTSIGAAYCWYNNDPASNKNSYGALYNWYAVDVKKLCPSGWHVPSKEDWEIMIDYLGGDNVAGGKLKEAGLSKWLSPNQGATNETGFTARPAGMRYFGDGSFINLGKDGRFWTSTVTNDQRFSWDFRLTYLGKYSTIGSYMKQTGYSVRCIKDN